MAPASRLTTPTHFARATAALLFTALLAAIAVKALTAASGDSDR